MLNECIDVITCVSPYLVQVKRNNRTLYVCYYEDRYQLTWDKNFAMKFRTKEEIDIKIKNDRLFELICKNFTIISLKDSKSF